MELLDTLQQLETSLHRPEVRNDPARLDSLLHPDFQEIGRSGNRYSRDEVLRDLVQSQAHPTLMSRDFSLRRISDDVALLTYKSAEVERDGDLTNLAFRSSIWKHTTQGWQMFFHQGTPTAAFAL